MPRNHKLGFLSPDLLHLPFIYSKQQETIKVTSSNYKSVSQQMNVTNGISHTCMEDLYPPGTVAAEVNCCYF